MRLEPCCAAMCHNGRLFMSTKQIIRSGLMGSVAFAALGLTACANSHAQSTRYGGETHYDYESAHSCGSSCTTGHTAPTPTYRPAPQAPRTHYGYEGVPCNTACGATTGVSSGFTTVAPSYPTVTTPSYPTISTTTSSVSTTGYAQETAPCPAGTSAQPDGSCMQSSGYTAGSSFTTGSSSTLGSSSYTSGSTYTGGSSFSSGGYSTSGGVAECPAGTTTQPDGSCLQRSGSSYSSHTSSSTYAAPVTSTYSSSYSSPSTSTYSSTYASPSPSVHTIPAPTTSTSVYTGDAVTSTYGGYATSGSNYSSSDYLPIRK